MLLFSMRSVAMTNMLLACFVVGVTGQAITLVTPLVGQTGTLVTITGTGLENVNQVSLAPFDTDNYDFNDGGALTVTAAADGTSVVVEVSMLKIGRCGSIVLYSNSTKEANYTSATDPFCYTNAGKWDSFTENAPCLLAPV
jgi:hypothetical protein